MRAVREPCTHRVRGASRAAAGSGRSKSGSPWWSTTVSRRPRPSTQAGTRAALWGLTGALVRSPAPRADGAGYVLEVGVVLWRRRDRGGGRQSRKLRGPGVASGRTTMYYAVRGPDGRPLVLTMEWRDGHLGLSARVGGMCRVYAQPGTTHT